MNFIDLFSQTSFPLFSATSSELPEPSIISFDANLLTSMIPIWINVIILIAVLALILYKPVRKFMAAREERIKNEIDSADELKKEAELLKEKYQAQLAKIDNEREEILLNANIKALERSEEIMKEAKEEAELIHKHAMEEIEEERMAMQADIKRQLIELSLSIAERFVTVSITPETQEKYVDDAIANWEENRWQE